MVARSLRDAWRSLRTRPVLSAAAILSLALGMGGVTALFSLVNAAVLRPLPVRDPHELVAVATERADSFPAAVWAEIRDRELLPGAFTWVFTEFDTAAAGEQQPVDGLMVSGNTFAVLGVRPAVGRLIETDDDRAGGGRDRRVAVLSHAFWHRRFGGQPSAIGRTLLLDRQSFTIVGVTDPSFTGLYGGLGFDVAIALDVVPQRFYRTVMGRLGPGDTPESLTAVLQAAQPSIRTATLPPTMAEPYRSQYLSEPMVVRPAPAGVSFLTRRYAYPLQILLGTSALLLLLACGNIAMLQTARSQERRRELSIRAAIGASGRRLAVMCLFESALVAVAGLAFGLWIARAAIGLILSHLSTQAVDIVLNVEPDWRVAVFAAVLVGLTTLLFGALPAWQARRSDPIDALRSRGATLDVPRLGLGVIAAQAAASVVLLASAALLGRSFMNLVSVPTGFEAERVLVVEIERPDTSRDGSDDAGGRDATSLARAEPRPVRSDTLETRLLDAVESAPGIEAAGLSNSVPAGNSATTPWLELDDGTKLPSGVVDGVFSHQVTPGWLATYGTRVVEGRGLTAQDRGGAPRVALVNRTFVERFVTGRSPLGTVLKEREYPDGPGHDVTVVGVVEDAIYRMLREDVPPTIYTALAQHTGVRFPTLQLSVRPRQGPDAAARHTIASVISEVDAGLSFRIRTVDDQVGAQVRRERLLAVVSSAFAVLGILLAAVGLYGVVSWTVARRRFELGVRAALGATQLALVDVVARPTAVALGIGLGAGVLAASLAAGLLQTLLFGVQPDDVMSLAVPCVVLLAVAAAAVLRPLHRAVRVDPSEALRTE